MQGIQSNTLNQQTKIQQIQKNGFYSKIKLSQTYPIKQPFQDIEFPHNQDSIQKGANIKPHLWIPAEELHHKPSFSSQLKNLQQIKFSKKSINQALMVLNWFTPNIFSQIIGKQINFNHFYCFNVMKNGVIQQIVIDSYVPVDALHNQELFAKNYQGSIFPCVYQKMLAKLYEDYNSITDDFVSLIQAQSLFCRQQRCISKLKTHQELENLKKIINSKINQKSIIFFKTRNSIRLSTFGLQPNCCYLLTRLIQFAEEKYGLVQFLQISGAKWIGKYSKLRSNWQLQEQFVLNNKLNIAQNLKQNYMSFQDLKGISKDIIILNNTENYHKNWIQSNCNKNYSTTSIRHQQDILNYYTFTLKQRNKIKIKLSTLKGLCRSSLILINVKDQQLSYTNKNQRIYKTSGLKQLQSKENFPKSYQIIKMSFKDHKSTNYLQFQCLPGRYIVAVIIQQQKNKGAHHVITVFSSSQKINLQSLVVQQYRTQIKPKEPFYVDLNYQILHEAFKMLIQKEQLKQLKAKNQKSQENNKNIIIKQLYQLCGLGLILIKVQKEAQFYLKVQINLQKMKQNHVIPLNDIVSHRQIRQGQHQLYIFKLYWSKVENEGSNSNMFISFKPQEKLQQKQKILFPPLQSIKITKIHQR